MKNNSILGLGSDLVEIDRIDNLIKRFGDKFLRRLFTNEERDYCEKHKHSSPRFAGRFAAKEAIAKALGKGFGSDITWLDISILPDNHGKPIVTLSKALSSRFNNPRIILTISHSKTLASATAIWTKE